MSDATTRPDDAQFRQGVMLRVIDYLMDELERLKPGFVFPDNPIHHETPIPPRPSTPETLRLRGEVTQLQVQLAGCGVAAKGGTFNIALRGDYGWSPAYQAVLELRLKYDQEHGKALHELDNIIAELRLMSRVQPSEGALPDDYAHRCLKVIQERQKALLQAVDFTKAYLVTLESQTESDDPLAQIRKKVHAPLHAKLDAALKTLEKTG